MTFHHFVLTLTGSAQQLSTNLKLQGMAISVQGTEGNTQPVYVGGDGTVSATVYGIRIPAPSAAGDPAPPLPLFPWNLSIRLPLSQIWVIGTLNEKVSVSYWVPS